MRALCTGKVGVIGVWLFLLFGSVKAQIADGKCKFLGNVIANDVPEDFNTYWDQVTPENAGKWGSVEGTRDVMNWAPLDRAYEHARDSGFPFRFHTLIWGNQQPLWIANLPPNEQLAEIEEWMQLVGERYPDPSWPSDVPFYVDVVNEPLNDPPNEPGDGGNYINALLGSDGLGNDWIIKSFELARQYMPTAKLHINEYNVLNSNGRTTQYLQIIEELQARDLIDGIGLQCHRFETENTNVNQLTNNLNRLAATGLPLYITEFDLGNFNDSPTGNAAQDDQIQLELYERIFPVFWDHPAVEGITLWGYQQGRTWQQSVFLVRANGEERPAMTWLKDYVANHPGGTFCGNVTHVEDAFEPTLKLYPNPSRDGFFSVDAGDEQMRLTIHDLQGRVVREVFADREVVKFQIEKKGLYMMRWESGKSSGVRKLLVE